MKIFPMLVVIAMGSFGAAACSEDETATATGTTTTTTGTTTGTGGMTATGGMGGMGGTTGMGGAGATGGETGQGGTGGASGGAGGMGACYTCNAYTSACATMNGQCPPESELCSGSDALFTDLKTCVCTECANQCELTCTGQGQDKNNCSACYQNASATTCMNELQACQTDV